MKVNSKTEYNNAIANAGSKLVVVDFYANWCSHCDTIKSTLDDISKESNVVVLMVNTDDLQALAEENHIDSLPTFYFFKNGRKVHEFTGGNEAKLRNAVKKYK